MDLDDLLDELVVAAADAHEVLGEEIDDKYTGTDAYARYQYRCAISRLGVKLHAYRAACAERDDPTEPIDAPAAANLRSIRPHVHGG